MYKSDRTEWALGLTQGGTSRLAAFKAGFIGWALISSGLVALVFTGKDTGRADVRIGSRLLTDRAASDLDPGVEPNGLLSPTSVGPQGALWVVVPSANTRRNHRSNHRVPAKNM